MPDPQLLRISEIENRLAEAEAAHADWVASCAGVKFGVPETAANQRWRYAASTRSNNANHELRVHAQDDLRALIAVAKAASRLGSNGFHGSYDNGSGYICVVCKVPVPCPLSVALIALNISKEA